MLKRVLPVVPFLLGACCLHQPVQAAVADGYVVRVESATVYLDWGKAAGVQVGGRFNLYRPGEALKHPVSGEELGKTEQAVGMGTLQSIDEKFSIGLLDRSGSGVVTVPQSGDRSRWVATPIPTTAISAVVPVVLGAATPSEVWRSEGLEKDPVGLAIADVDGDQKKDVIIAYRKTIQVYRWVDKRLTPLATFDDRSYRHWLAIETAALKRQGPNEIFATTYVDGLNRARVVVLRWEGGALKKVADFEGFARTLAQANGEPKLYWQGLSRSRVLNYTPVAELTWDQKEYRPGRVIDKKLAEGQLFGFTWGDWDADGQEDVAVLERGERLHLVSKTLKWRSSNLYGGTRNDFAYEEDSLGVFNPRLTRFRPTGTERDQLILPTNFADLSAHLTYLKFYKRSELEALSWTGSEMAAVWKLAIPAYLADFAISDLATPTVPALWTLVAKPDDKAILISYNLP